MAVRGIFAIDKIFVSDWFIIRYVLKKDENIFLKTPKLKFDPNAINKYLRSMASMPV